MLDEATVARVLALIFARGLGPATAALGIGNQTMEAARFSGTMQVATAARLTAALDRLDAESAGKAT